LLLVCCLSVLSLFCRCAAPPLRGGDFVFFLQQFAAFLSFRGVPPVLSFSLCLLLRRRALQLLRGFRCCAICSRKRSSIELSAFPACRIHVWHRMLLLLGCSAFEALGGRPNFCGTFPPHDLRLCESCLVRPCQLRRSRCFICTRFPSG
jgi:hypothetical protein